MFSAIEFKLARRYTKSKKSDGFVSMVSAFSFIGILLGVATLIVVMSVMSGLKDKMMEHIFKFRGHVSVYPTGGQGYFTDYKKLAASIKKLPSVQTASAVAEKQALALRGEIIQGAAIHAMSQADIEERAFIRDQITDGQLSIDEDREAVGIGYYMAQKLGIKVGEKIKIMNPQGTVTPFGMMPRIVSYPVDYIFKTGHKDVDENLISMPLKLLQMVFNVEGKITGFEIVLKDQNAIDTFKKEVKTALPGLKFRVVDWQSANTGFVGAIQVQQNVMFIVLSMIVLIAAFNIISSLTMLVQQKMKDIAILRTLGLSRSSLVRIFFIIGSSIGFWGTLFGTLAGLLLADNIDLLRVFLENTFGTKLYHAEVFWLTSLPSTIIPANVIKVVAMSLTLSFLATLYPAWRAAKLDPAEVLRYE